MRTIPLSLLVLVACSGQKSSNELAGAASVPQQGGAHPAPPPTTPPPPPATPTPPVTPPAPPAPVAPDGQLTFTPGPTPDSAQQQLLWTSTGAAGCEGLVPAAVSPRLSWSAGTFCAEGEPTVDGAGDVAMPFDNSGGSEPFRLIYAILPGSGAQGTLVTNGSKTLSLGLVPRPDGFYATAQDSLGSKNMFLRKIGPDGSDQGLVRPSNTSPLLATPQGGFIETSFDTSVSADGHFVNQLSLRWLDADLAPQTGFIPVTTWGSSNLSASYAVDALGNALVLADFTAPMSSPCIGAAASGFWVTPGGQVTPLTPITPGWLNQFSCGSQPNYDFFTGFGTGLVLPGGGLAFHVQEQKSAQMVTPTGWYASYGSNSATVSQAPAWLADKGSVQRLGNGRGYVGVTHDPATCSRTAQIIGAAGQVCATAPLDGSDGCDSAEELSPDGTLLLHAFNSCEVRWWPKLGQSPATAE